MALRTIDLEPNIGAEIFADVESLLAGRHAAEIRELLDRRGVLLFRRLNLTEEQQLAFSRTLGAVFEPQGAVTHSGVVTISMDKKVMKEAETFTGSFLWHFDGSNSRKPPRASLLSARATSRHGGETEFANSSAAYEDLPDPEKEAYGKVRVLHSLLSRYRIANLHPSEEVLTQWRKSSPQPISMPLVWKHASGRKSLVVGSTADQVEDGALDDAVLQRLLNWVTQPRYVYRHSWEVGDLIIYDNTGVLHRALPYKADSGRVLQRTKLLGEEECI